ncbi:MAG: SusC/RagA family TonB-linked outer membrane protein [Bacteroidales bacterium]
MKQSFLSLLLLIAGLFLVSSVQSQTIRGVVTDASSGETLPGASIRVKDATLGTTTEIDGDYSLNLPAGSHTIIYSFVGFSTQEISITIEEGETIVRDISMEPAALTFEETVVIGYGSQQKIVTTGSISSIDSEAINRIPLLRTEQALQGQTAGVQVTSLSGQPGEAPTVRIRGAGTTGDAEPLYIVDGMAVGGIDYLNPGDIESIDVLKDAASAAIYGARAANGVVLITTKTGTEGQMNVSYSGYQGIQNAARTIDMLNAEQYRMMMNEGARNSGLTEPFDPNEIPAHDTDWQDALFQSDVPMFNHQLSVNGGTDKSTYASSMSYFSQQGIIGGEKSKFDRITARLNSDHQVNDFFNFGSNLSYTHTSQRGIASNASFNAAYGSALNLDPLTPVFQEDENILAQRPYSTEPVVTNDRGQVYGISDFVGAEIVNPLALLETQRGETRVDKFVGNMYGEVEILESLRFKSTLGLDLGYVVNDSHTPLFYLNGAQLNTDKTTVSKNINRFHTWQFENTLSYNRQIQEHNISGLIGVTARKFNFEDLSGFNADVSTADPDNVYLSMARDTVWTAYGGANHSALLSQFGRILYDYKSTYSLNITLRRDGSSKFGANNRYGIFPSVGTSWNISYEDFFPELGPVNLVKLKASWGINGNQEIGDYQFLSTMDMSRGYIFGGGRAFGASPSFIDNPDIRWEESEQIDIGFEMGAFENRLNAAFDYYIKTTSGLLERIPIPAHVGNDPPFANVGSVQNRGVELSLDWRHYSNNVRYSIGINGAYNQNEMTKIGNEEGVLPGATWAVAGMVTRAEIGRPIGYFWGYKTNGIFQNMAEVYQHINNQGRLLQPSAKPGDVRFVDVNDDGVINSNDRTMIGNPTPAWTFGMDANIEYRQFDLAVLFIGSYGNDVFNGMQRPDLRYTNRTTDILNRWTGEGTSNTVPRFTWIDRNNNNRISDLYIEDGSFLRLKNVQIGYNFPERITGRINATSLRLYLSAENLLTITGYTGADPEIGAMSSFDIGIDRGVYPQSRTFRLGVNVSF